MTNAEKLAKDIQFMTNAVLHYDCSNHKCKECILNGKERCERNSSTVKQWLESEVNDDGKV